MRNFSAGGEVSWQSLQLLMISTSSCPALSCCSPTLKAASLSSSIPPPSGGEKRERTLSISFSSLSHWKHYSLEISTLTETQVTVRMFCLFSLPSTQVISLSRRSITALVARWVSSKEVNFGLDLMYSMTWRQVYW